METANFHSLTVEPRVDLRQDMNRWLVRTGWLELSNVLWCSLALCIASLFHQRIIGFFSIMSLITFNAIAIQAGLYWLAKHHGMFKVVKARTCLRMICGLYIFDISLLLFIPATLVFASTNGWASDPAELLIGSGFYLFGLGKFLHYYLFKINRYSIFKTATALPCTHSPARFRREFQRARNRMSVRNKSMSMR